MDAERPAGIQRRSMNASLLPALAVPLLLCASLAVAAPHEITVFDDEVEDPGAIGLDIHVNHARGRRTPDFASEIPPHRATRLMPEVIVGLKQDWELGLHFPMQVDGNGRYHSDGLRVRVKHVLPRPDSQPFYAGFNVELGHDRPHLSEDRHNFELRGIVGWNAGPWKVAFNPIFAWVLKGANKSGRPDFEASLKVAREVGGGWSAGIEHYAGLGRWGSFAPRREQDHMLYVALDYAGKDFGLNLGAGGGLTPASDNFVVKAVVSVPFR